MTAPRCASVWPRPARRKSRPAFLLKDATALINGATASLPYAVLAAHDARELLSSATVSAAMSLEALRGELSCFEDRVMLARPHRGQRRVATAIRQRVAGTG